MLLDGGLLGSSVSDPYSGRTSLGDAIIDRNGVSVDKIKQVDYTSDQTGRPFLVMFVTTLSVGVPGRLIRGCS